jgi:hypothetical protein
MVMADDRTELDALKDKLAASQRMGSGYSARIEAIKARIAEIEREQADEGNE